MKVHLKDKEYPFLFSINPQNEPIKPFATVICADSRAWESGQEQGKIDSLHLTLTTTESTSLSIIITGLIKAQQINYYSQSSFITITTIFFFILTYRINYYRVIKIPYQRFIIRAVNPQILATTSVLRKSFTNHCFIRYSQSKHLTTEIK